MAIVAPATVDDLGLPGCLYLWALLTAQARRRPVAPTRRLAMVAVSLLCEHGIITVPWPQARWPCQPDALDTPIEGIQWRWCWSAYTTEHVVPALEDFLGSVSHDDFAVALQLRVWNDLLVAEAEDFFERQLLRHRFEAEWAQDIGFAVRESQVELSIAQWRYCGWAAVRHGASLAMQQGGARDGLREGIYAELRRRATRVSSGNWGECAFSPAQAEPSSALARGFTRLLAPLGMGYWTEVPKVQALLGYRLAQAR